MERFFVAPEAVEGERARLGGEELSHARRVLRLAEGDEVELLDGEGGRYRGRFLTSRKDDGELAILSRATEPEPAFALTLALSPLKGERFDWALEKATELGAAAFLPLLCERTEVRPPSGGGKTDRWSRVIAAACKQCGRARFPRLLPPLPLKELPAGKWEQVVVLWEKNGADALAGIASGGRSPRSCLLVVGPEGGFTEGEGKVLERLGAYRAGLGPRILRAETAAVAGTALLQHLWGDLGGA